MMGSCSYIDLPLNRRGSAYERVYTVLHDLSYRWMYTCYRLDLGVNSNFPEVRDLKETKINH